MEKLPEKIEISHRTIIFTILFLLSLYFFYQIRQVLMLLFVSFILMSALNPTITRLEKIKIPRFIGILLIYLIIICVLGFSLAGVVPPLVDQTSTLIASIPDYARALNIDGKLISEQINQLGSIPTNLFKLTVGIFNNLTALFVLAVITFYLLIERENLDRYLSVLFGGDGKDRAKAFIDKVEERLGGWIRGEVALMLIVGLMTYIGLRLLGIEFALPLAILAGILEVIPNVGPVISAIPAVLTGLTVSPLMALSVAALYFLTQQIENGLIVPQVMARQAKVKPLVVIIALAIGFKIAGLIGAVLAVPMAILLQLVLAEFFHFQGFNKSESLEKAA